MNFNEVINKRYSVRKFKDEKVDDNIIEQILETGRIAPSAGNNQPAVVTLLTEKQLEMLQNDEEAKVHPVIFKTKNVLLICYNKNLEMKRPFDNYTFGNTDASIVTTYMMLKITELGLGSTWVGWFNSNQVKKTLELPDELEVVAMLPFGYIHEDCVPSKLHDERKSMKEFRF